MSAGQHSCNPPIDDPEPWEGGFPVIEHRHPVDGRERGQVELAVIVSNLDLHILLIYTVFEVWAMQFISR